MGLSLSIKAALEAFDQLLATWQKAIEEQTTSEVVRDKRKLKKASNITEEILEITDRYTSSFTEKDLKNYEKLKKKFLKVN